MDSTFPEDLRENAEVVTGDDLTPGDVVQFERSGDQSVVITHRSLEATNGVPSFLVVAGSGPGVLRFVQLRAAPRFAPWVGDDYTRGLNGLRVLVLGESHYSPSSDLPRAFTRRVVFEQVWSRRGRFFARVARLLRDQPDLRMDVTEFRAIWSAISFYNFVQEIVGERSRRRPTEAMWQNAAGPFLSVLDALRPHVILMLGIELAHRVPLSTTEVIAGTQIVSHAYRLADGTVALAGSVPHPSSFGFRPAEWQPRVAQLMSDARHHFCTVT